MGNPRISQHNHAFHLKTHHAHRGGDSELNKKHVSSVDIPGASTKVEWKQEPRALVVTKPGSIPNKRAVAIQISLNP